MTDPTTTRMDPPEAPGRHTDARRSVLAEAIIALAVCAGASLMIVDPIERRLGDAHTDLAGLRARAEEAARRVETPEALATIRAAKARADQIAAASVFAIDEGVLLSHVSELAREHGLRLDEMQPGVQREQRSSAGKAPPPGESRSGYTFRFVGRFEAAAALLADLEHRTGLSAVRSVRLSPIPEPGTRDLQVIVETEHFAFTPPPLSSGRAPATASAATTQDSAR